MLSKGLKFVPTPDKTCLKTIVNSFKQFRRSMYIHYHFRNSSNDHPNPFKTTSEWNPPLPDNPNLLSHICSVAESIHQTFSHKSHEQLTSNLNEEEIKFLATYNIHNKKYVIKQQTRGVLSLYGLQQTMKRKHFLNLMTTNIMNAYQPTPPQSSQTKPQKSSSMSKISTNLETLTTKHCNTYCHLHHHVHPFAISYRKFTSLETQADQSYQGVIHQQTGFLYSLISTSNRCAVHYHPTSKTPIIFYKPFSTLTHHYHLTPSSLPLMSNHYTLTSHTLRGSMLSWKH